MENNQDLVIVANSDFDIRFTVTSDSTGLPIPVGDIEGASWGITPLNEEVTPLITKDLTVSNQIIVPSDGVVVVKLLASDTANLSGEFSHELRLKDTNNFRVASRGRLTIRYQIANNPL